MHEARQAKESYYPELQGTGRCPLVVFAVEGRGAMKHRSSTVPPLSCPQHSPNSPSTNMPCHSHGSHCSVGRLPHACAGKRISLSWGSSWPKTQKFPSPQPPAWPIANSTAQLWISCVDFPSVTLNETFCRKANTVHAYRLTQQKNHGKTFGMRGRGVKVFVNDSNLFFRTWWPHDACKPANTEQRRQARWQGELETSTSTRSFLALFC